MTDKEKIKEEIESYKESMKGLEPHSDFRRGQITAYNHIIQFIDSLPKEPVSEDLEEAARYYLLNNHTSPLNNILHQADLKVEMQYHKDIENAFKAGAHWQHGKDFDDLLQSEMEFPKEFYDRGRADAMNEMREALQTEYEKGRFDMREKMMKALIGGEVVKDMHNQLSVKSEPLNNTFGDIKFGEKVKIIIIKPEQQ